MSSTVLGQKPVVDYFSSNKSRSQQSSASISPPIVWDSEPYNDPVLGASDTCDSVFTSPTSPESLAFPNNYYSLPKEEAKDQAFDFGSFEDWMRWDDPSDAALSPTSDYFPELKTEPMSPNMGALNLQSRPSIDNTPIFRNDPMNDVSLFQTPNSTIAPQVTDLSPREGLYSTPLSWSRPSIGSRRSISIPNTYPGILSAQQESELRSIAMPSLSNKYHESPSSSPEPCSENKRRKRKNSSDDEEDEEDSPPPSSHPPVKKTAHNMIEKRYRTNLNDKIAALRDSVPALRVMSKKNKQGEEIQEDLQGLTPAHKLNKATVLSKATEYIAHLEKRNRTLTKENSALKSRVDAFEILMMARNPQPQQQLPTPINGSNRQW